MCSGGQLLIESPALPGALRCFGVPGESHLAELNVVGPNVFAAALMPVSGDWRVWRATARAGYEKIFDRPAQPSPVDMVAVMAFLRKRLTADVAQPIVIILNNGVFGTIRARRERRYPGRASGATPENPDFSALARAHGYHAGRVACTQDFPAAFERALASNTGDELALAIASKEKA
jgi:hypothetical protein